MSDCPLQVKSVRGQSLRELKEFLDQKAKNVRGDFAEMMYVM